MIGHYHILSYCETRISFLKQQQLLLRNPSKRCIFYAVFFGGSIADGAIAALFASIIAAAQKQLSMTKIKTIESNLIISLFLGLAAGILTIAIPSLHMDKILIGDIMLLFRGRRALMYNEAI